MATETGSGQLVPAGPVTVTPGDPRYEDLLLRGYNKRYTKAPESIRVVGTTAHVVQAVNDAVRAGKQIAVRGGGHCLDALVDNPDVQMVIDFTEMRAVGYDPQRKAFMIEPGATLGQIYRTLDYGWKVTLPGGVCPQVGAGGHIIGAGFGALSRQHGVIADHLYAVEVVVVGSDGQARAVVATRESSDPNRDLWWAHTGAGGGNFGVVTRFWMRSPTATASTSPDKMLPPSPTSLMTARAVWNWSDLTADSFVQLARNFGTWLEQNSAPGAPATALHGAFAASRVEAKQLVIVGQTDPAVSGNEALLDSYLAAMGQQLPVAPQIFKSGRLPWLSSTINAPDSSVAAGVTGPPRWKSKVAVMKKRYTDAQMAAAYGHLTRTNYANRSSSFSMTFYGGRINAVAADATAHAHRNAVLTGAVSAVWDTPGDDDKHMTWVRELYRDLYADTGGVPVPNDRNDGCHVNWPDLDLLDAKWNSSTTPVPKLFHQENYSRLQQVKAKWDPRNVFRHPLSIRA
ncbi:FAD-binding oxidoreductase [Streptomyces sp. NPDC059788]|uniref:FAD-binding oxidoreductase n=1 Tax=Streptomyces sp. NPDC059788 TaxID=3346948 RepID=UPI003648A794